MKKILFVFLFLVYSFVNSAVFWVGVYDWKDRNMILDPKKWWASDTISTIGTWTWQEESLLQVIKNAINWVLGILALIALCILLWWWFQMVTAAGDDKKYDAGLTYVKEAAWWIAMIGVAWFIVSIIFFIINIATK